jgi:hypothetical protein
VELKIIPVHGDTVYAEIGGEATTASMKVENGLFISDEMEVSFLAVDSTGTHPPGPAQTWKNRVTLKYRLFSGPAGRKMLELKAAPNSDGRTEVRYTTDGSDPKLNGGTYDGAVEIAKGTQVVLAFAQCDGIPSDVLNIPISWDAPETETPIDPDKPLVWRRRHECGITLESYDFMDRLKRHEAGVTGAKISVTGDRWAELTMHEKLKLDAGQLREVAEAIRKLPGSGQLAVEAAAIHFDRGQRLLDWLNEVKTELKPGEVQQ